MMPKMLRIKNFMSHSYSEIDFNKFNMALILGCYGNNVEESNGTGKSSLLEAIRWVLFDKARHKKKDGIVKRDAPACLVEFQFEVDGQLYKIIRKRNKIVGESEVNLYRFDNNNFVHIECDTNTITDRKIVEIINFNHDVFINSVYFKQGDISIFTESTPGKRKDVLKNLLKLDKWDDYQKIAKRKYSKISTKIAEKAAVSKEVCLIEDEIEECEEEMNKIKSSIRDLDSEIKFMSSLLLEKNTEYQFVVDEVEHNKLKELETDLLEKKKAIKNIKRSMTNNIKIIDNNKEVIKDIKIDLDKCIKAIEIKNSIDIEKKRSALQVGKTKFKILKERIDYISKDLKSDDKCDFCFRPISSKKEAYQIRKDRKNELVSLKEKYNILGSKINNSTKAFNRLDGMVDIGRKAEIKRSKLEAKINILESELKKAILENKSLKKQISSIDIENIESEILSLKLRLDKDNIDNLRSEISKIEIKLNKAIKDRDSLNIDYGSKVSILEDLQTQKKKQEKIEKELSELREELILYDKLRHCFGKDGIQSIIIENVVEELENYTNTTLSKICNEPTSINILMQKQSESGSWNETFDIEVNAGNRKDEFEALSGGEKFRISMALRLAFSKILSKRMGGSVQFLLLDEVSSSLDAKGLNMFVNIVEHLSSEMKVLIITHDDRLKDKFEDIIVVEKDESGSRVII